MEKLRLFKCWKALLLLLSISMFSMSVYAQSRSVTGVVTDEKGEPLIGASVRLKNGRLTTSTDINGHFSLNVPATETALIVTYVGNVDQEVPITAQTTNVGTVKMSASARSLNDVVVVGYGTQRKKDVTGSVSSVSNATLQEVPAANITQQLQGRVAGLDIQTNSSTPGSTGQFRIRGERSLGTTQGNNDAVNGPLFVVDGVPFIGGSLNDINPDDIQSIDVLKDASATAIYGSRGSGGVIIITTKRGKAGRQLVSFNTYFGVSKILNEYPVMNGAEFAAFKNEGAAGNTASPGTFTYAFTAAELAGIANGTSTDWQKLIYRAGFTSDNNLNISGGNETTQYSISGGYHQDKGVQYGQNFDRGSIRFTIDHNISKRVKVGLTNLQTLEHTNGSGLFPLYNTVAISPLTSPYNADGSINLLPMTGSVDQPNRINPLTARNQYIQNLNRRIYAFNSAYGEVSILDGLKFRTTGTFTFGQTQGNNYQPANTIYNPVTLQSQTNESNTNSQAYTWLVENLLTYDKVFAQKHHVTFTGLYSLEKDHSDNTGLSGLGLTSDYLQSYALNFANSVTANTGGYSERRLVSLMGRVTYAYNDKYLLTATIRNDGTSVLTPGHQHFTYPAIGLGWNIDREDFMKNQNVISALKLRGGYGITADQNISPYQTLGGLSSNNYNFGTNNVTGYYVTSIPSTALKFEHTNVLNLAVDYGLFKDRITGSVDVYTQKTYDILQQENLPNSQGAYNTLINAGRTKGSGIDVSISTINIKNLGGFSWSTDGTFSVSRSSITALHDNLQSDVGNGWFVGQPFNIIYDYKKIGIWQTSEAAQAAVYGQKPGQIKIEDVNHDNKINASDAQILGSYTPKFTAGMTNRFSYKGIDLSFVATSRIGQKVAVTYLAADNGGSGFPFFDQGRVNQVKTNYWTPTNPTNDFPRPDASMTGPLYGSTLQYRDGSFVRMKSINLGYTIPGKIVKHAGFSSLRIYATCNNPFFIYAPLVRDHLAIDPEGNGYGNQLAGVSSFGTNALGRAVTVGLSTPTTRSYIIGINAKF